MFGARVVQLAAQPNSNAGLAQQLGIKRGGGAKKNIIISKHTQHTQHSNTATHQHTQHTQHSNTPTHTQHRQKTMVKRCDLLKILDFLDPMSASVHKLGTVAAIEKAIMDHISDPCTPPPCSSCTSPSSSDQSPASPCVRPPKPRPNYDEMMDERNRRNREIEKENKRRAKAGLPQIGMIR